MKLVVYASTCLAIVSCSLASAVPAVSRLTHISQPSSEWSNPPQPRGQWTNGFSLDTDVDTVFPTTGNTVTYNWEITNSTCDPDGTGGRTCFLVNGQYPGPVLRGSWGDNVVVNVKNSLQDNGTSVHWHGVRQLNSPGSDGTGGITECPIAPGDTRTYRFKVTQYGTSLYHSHFEAQYGDGVVGPIVFEGPASEDYDIDLGPYPINEWYYKTSWQVDSLGLQALQNAASGALPPHANTILINGTNKNANGGGEYSQVSITPGKKHLLRLVNIGIDNYLRISLDGHVMQVISADFVPVEPFYTETLLMAPGQRHDVIINANQTPGNYWFRAHVAPICGSTNNFNGSAIWTYLGVEVDTPASESFTIPIDCDERPDLAPYRKQVVPSESLTEAFKELGVNFTSQTYPPNGDAVVVWALNDTAIDVDWDKPTLAYVLEGNTSYPIDFNLIPTLNEGAWNYWVIQQLNTVPAVPHPMHLHGHDFFVLGQGLGQFNLSTANLNYNTPPRRDTASVYGAGWLAIAFMSNNPGAWLVHCHIARHISAGLGFQFLEAPSEIVLPDRATFDQGCKNWQEYQAKAIYQKEGSGL